MSHVFATRSTFLNEGGGVGLDKLHAAPLGVSCNGVWRLGAGATPLPLEGLSWWAPGTLHI